MAQEYKIELKTSYYENGDIIHETDYNPGNDLLHNRQIEIIKTKEENTKNALIALGWTPPKEQK